MNETNLGKATLYVIDSQCQVCRRCLAQKVCKTKALVRIDPDDSPFVDVHRCMGCQLCIAECPYGAISSR